MSDNRPTKKAEGMKREEEIWELRAQGWTHQRIADKLDIDQSTVTKALKRAAHKHHEKFMADIHEYKKNQAQAIEAAAYNALEQYYKSQKDKNIVIKTGKTDDKGKFLKGAVTTVQKIGQSGDAKLLGMFFKGMEDLRKIWGFDHVPKTAAEGGKPSLDNLTIDEKVALFCSMPPQDRIRVLDSMITNRARLNEPSSSDEQSDSE